MTKSVKELGIEISAASDKQRDYAESMANSFLVLLDSEIDRLKSRQMMTAEQFLRAAWDVAVDSLERDREQAIEALRGMDAREIIDNVKDGRFLSRGHFRVDEMVKRAHDAFNAKKAEILSK